MIRRLTYNSPERLLTGLSPHYWIPVEELQKAGWQSLYNNFKQTQQELVHLLQNKEDQFLEELLAGTEHNKEYYIAGLLHHDVYHLGQIGLILKWAK